MIPFSAVLTPSAIIPGVTSFAVCLFLVLTKDWHGKHSLDTDHGVQKFHTAPTPRIGGLALLLGLVIAILMVSAPVAKLMKPMLLAGVPAFAAGFLEDLTKRVGVRDRLLATMFSGVMAWWLTGYTLNRVEVAGFDLLFAWLPFSILFTAFAVGGIANAVNIIDGFNGLAGGTLIICFGAFSLIALKVGDASLAYACITFIMVIIGFMLLNFPFGKIFMGDGGAYLMGFLLAWTAVMLPMRNPGVSKWASLLVCGYPLIETLYSMARRRWNKCHPGQPDNEHLHSLIKLKVVRRYFHYLPQSLRNSLVSPFSWLLAALFASQALLFYRESGLLMGVMFTMFVLYSGIHAMLSRLPAGD